MVVYYYTRILWGTSGISIESTDTQLLNDIVTELKKFAPKCVILASSDIENIRCSLRISQLNGKDSETGIWLLRWMGLQGWEVFHGTDFYSGNFSLRKQESKQ